MMVLMSSKQGSENFLEQKRIQRLEWPGNSPDLNRIENLWNFIKKKVL